MTRLSPHFTLEEFTFSQAAARLGLKNAPSPLILKRLAEVAGWMENVRALLSNRPIVISSGYRSLAVNRAVKGSKNSAHISGYAVDFTCPAFGAPLVVAKKIAASDIPFDQLIYEFGAWVHISFAPAMRGQRLTIDGDGVRLGLLP